MWGGKLRQEIGSSPDESIFPSQKFHHGFAGTCGRIPACYAGKLKHRRKRVGYCTATPSKVVAASLQGATIRPIVPRQKHSIVFIVHH